MSIYTRTGDNGTTALFGGKRVPKCEELVDLYGSIDELNSWIGLVTTYLETYDVRSFLGEIQTDLFVIGSILSGWKGSPAQINRRIGEMEARIDNMERDLPGLTRFIIPGGSQLSSYIHIARSICRRVERQVVSFSQKQKIDPVIIRYLNRLSDLFFVLARLINKLENVPEKTWTGSDRKAET